MRSLRLCAATLLLSACSRQLGPAGPSVVAHPAGYYKGYPLPVGSPISVSASWEARCAETDGGLPFLERHRPSPRKWACDAKPYDLTIWCERWGTEPGPACEIRVDSDPKVPNRGVFFDRLVWADVDRSRGFSVTLRGTKPVAITVTVSRDGKQQTYRTPFYFYAVPSELVVECGVGLSKGGRPCDEGLAPVPGADVWMVVRSPADGWQSYLQLQEVRVNGVAQRANQSFPLGQVLPRSAFDRSRLPVPGIHRVTVEANPPPHRITRVIDVRLLPIAAAR